VRNRAGFFTCEDCRHRDEDLTTTERFYFPTVALMPLYVKSTLFPVETLEKMTRSYIRDFLANGDRGRIVGYQPGLVLYNLKAMNSPLIPRATAAAMSFFDDAGACSEFYNDGLPINTRCRPWESCINIEALLKNRGSE